MIWLTWRQFRVQAWTGAVMLAVVAAALLLTAPSMFDLYDVSAYASCTADCGDAARLFLDEMERTWLAGVYVGGTAIVFLLPAVIGVFWGAPLVARELEAGTHRLVWSQTVSRGRWIAVKLLGVGMAVVLLTGVVSLLVTWWTEPTDGANGGRIGPLIFAARGVVPIGYAAFAFAAGVLIGLIARRTVPAMAVTLLVVALVQVAVPFLARPAYSSPVHATAALDMERLDSFGIHPDQSVTITLEPPEKGAWVLSNTTIDSTGKVYKGPVDRTYCGPQSGFDQCRAYLGTLDLRQDITYVPVERFWTVQWREFALFAVVTAMLSVIGIWWIRRRVA